MADASPLQSKGINNRGLEYLPARDWLVLINVYFEISSPIPLLPCAQLQGTNVGRGKPGSQTCQ
jgi:hypothetical protein